jgi:hypothetical protein
MQAPFMEAGVQAAKNQNKGAFLPAYRQVKTGLSAPATDGCGIKALVVRLKRYYARNPAHKARCTL